MTSIVSFVLSFFTSYDELLEISQHGDNQALDLTVGDIYGDTGYSEVIWCNIKFWFNSIVSKNNNKIK